MKGFVSLLVAAAVAAAATGSAAANNGPRSAILPNDRANDGPALAAASSSETLRPDDRAQHGVGSLSASVQPQSSAIRLDRFDWLDAGIGAGAAAFGLLIVAGSAVLLRRQRTTAYSS